MNLQLTYVENPKTCDAFFRVTCEEKGITTVKNLTVEETLRLLGKSTYENEVKYYDPGEKPYGYVKHFASDRADTFKIALLYPAKKRGVKYFTDTYFVPYPNVLYIYEVRKGYVQTKRCFAVKDKEIKPDTKLYRFPFGNVTGDTGSMCYGNIKFPRLKNMSDIDKVVDLFLSGGVNDDLWHGNISKKWKQFELFQYLENKKTFPSNLLVEVEGNATTFDKVFRATGYGW